MLEKHLNSPITRRRLRTGPAADYLDAFSDWLYRQGYRPFCIDNLLTSLAGWTDWMLAEGFTAQDALAAFEACKLAIERTPHVRYSRGPNRRSVTAASVFIRFFNTRVNCRSLCLHLPSVNCGRYWENSVRGCENIVE